MLSLHVRRTLRALLALAVAASLGCIIDVTTPYGDGSSGPSVANIPAVSSSAASFGFAVLGSHFALDQQYSSPLPSGAVRVAVALTQYDGGTVKAEIRDATGLLIFSQQLQGNVAQSVQEMRGTSPFSVRLVFSSFSGSFAFSATPAN